MSDLIEYASNFAADVILMAQVAEEAAFYLELYEEQVYKGADTKDSEILNKLMPVTDDYLARCLETIRASQILRRQILFNIAYNKPIKRKFAVGSGAKKKIEEHSESEDYDIKKSVAKEINDRLRAVDAAIVHPETGEPCVLYAVWSMNGNGRYTLESRITKKRKGSWQSVSEIVPMKLMPDVPRKEGLIEARKDKNDSQ